MNQKITLLKSNLAAKGGLEKYTLYLANAFQKKGCTVTLLTSGEVVNDPLLENVEVISVAPKAKMSYRHLQEFDKAVKDYLKTHKSQIIFGLDRNTHQTHYRAGNGVHAAYLQRRQKEASFFKKLSFFINPLHRTLLKHEKQCYEDPHLNTIFTNSQMVKEEILFFYNTDPNKIKVIHNGVEWKKFATPFQLWPNEREKYLLQFGLDPNCLQLLFLGHDYRRKGLKNLLRACARFKKHRIQLSVVGKDKKQREFQSLARSLGIANNVKFFGTQSSITPFLQMADSLILPTSYDPFANVTLEALAMGLYVITSKDNGAHEILNETVGYIIENSREPQSICSALTKALDHRKTFPTSQLIRDQVKKFDFTSQLNLMVDKTLSIQPKYN